MRVKPPPPAYKNSSPPPSYKALGLSPGIAAAHAAFGRKSSIRRAQPKIVTGVNVRSLARTFGNVVPKNVGLSTPIPAAVATRYSPENVIRAQTGMSNENL